MGSGTVPTVVIEEPEAPPPAHEGADGDGGGFLAGAEDYAVPDGAAAVAALREVVAPRAQA